MLVFSGTMYLDAEKIEGCGEDALTYQFDENGNGYMFVFDGCGGAGSQKHIDLESKKSAYVASRCCAFFSDYYLERSTLHSSQGVNLFSEQLHSYLTRVDEHFPMEPSESTLVDILPTTISGINITNDNDCLSATYIWGGDSRGYIIDANGISQVTEDDVSSEDAFTNITDNSIMNNRIHGAAQKEPFTLHSTTINMKEKCILLCATDGCYDYFNSPMVFEYLMLSVIMASSCYSEAESQLQQILKERSGDDCSMIIAFFGFEEYEEIKIFLRNRYQALDKDKDSFGASQGKIYWDSGYKTHYYRYNPLRSDIHG